MRIFRNGQTYHWTYQVSDIVQFFIFILKDSTEMIPLLQLNSVRITLNISKRFV